NPQSPFPMRSAEFGVRNGRLASRQFLEVASSSSKSTISLIWTKNHLSILVRLKISSMVKPARRAWRMKKMRSALGTLSLRLMTSAREDVAVAINLRADAPGLAVAAQAAAANLQRAQAFLQAFLERAPDGHRFAHAFHLRGERGVGLRKFLEGKARNLGDDVINARLEARGGFARDVVLQFVEEEADGEFGRDLRDGKSGRLGRERRGADDERKAPDLFRDVAGFVEIVRDAGDGDVEADLKHQFLERKTVFAFVNRVRFRADHLDAVFVQDAGLVQGHCRIQCGLAAE